MKTMPASRRQVNAAASELGSIKTPKKSKASAENLAKAREAKAKKHTKEGK